MAPGQFPPRPYVAEDTIAKTTQMSIQSAGAGFLFAATQASLAKQNVGITGSFTKFGRTFGMFTAGGAAYQFAKSSSKNLRQSDDGWNAALGGMTGGGIIGLFRGSSLPVVFGLGAGLAVVAAVFDVSGGLRSFGYGQEGVDRVTILENLRKNYRQPVEETIAEIGEGRGLYGPNYAERRRKHFKEKYDIDIPVYPPAAESYAAHLRPTWPSSE